MPIQMPSKNPVLVAMACAALLLFAACSTKSTSLPAKAAVSNGLYPYVTPLCTPHAVFGAAGAGVTTVFNNGFLGSRYNLAVPGIAYSIGVYVDSQWSDFLSGKDICRVALYSDNAGRPQNLLTTSGMARLAVGWNELDITDMYVAPGWYWIMVLDYGGSNIAYNSASVSQSVAVSGYYSSAYNVPATFMTLTSYQYVSRLYSLKVNYCP